MAFVKVREINEAEKIINTDCIVTISSARLWNGDRIYTVIFQNDTSCVYSRGEIEKIFDVIDTSIY